MKDRCLVLIARYPEDETSDCVSFYLSGKKVSKESIDQSQSQVILSDTGGQHENVVIIQYCLDAHVASCFRSELARSSLFRRQVWAHLSTTPLQIKTVIVQILIMSPKQHQLDYRFCSRVQLLVNETIELDHIMSCLSTLGGAFSSLGDQFLDCAKTAGRISSQQYKIAEKLGDPVTLLRCQLYLSISLIQCNRLRNAKVVISSVYRLMKSKPEDLQDRRVISMCLGIWAKLKYHWQLEQNRRKILNITR